MLSVRVVTPLKPSEDPEKVEKAIRAIFPDADLHGRDGHLEATTGSLDRFKDLVWRAKILDAARRVLLGSLHGSQDQSRFSLNKQAALAGHVSFSVGEAPLGDLAVNVTGDGLEDLFKAIAPPTLRGRPVTEEEYELHLMKEKRVKAARKATPLEVPPLEGIEHDEELMGGDDPA